MPQRWLMPNAALESTYTSPAMLAPRSLAYATAANASAEAATIAYNSASALDSATTLCCLE